MVPVENRMSYRVEIEREDDGRWIAEVVALPGVLAYGSSPENALANAQAMALRVLADRIEHGEPPHGPLSLRFETSIAP
jgi:predicted RNase H-like HicB family nuclease